MNPAGPRITGRYGHAMPKVTVAPLVLRTTSDPGGVGAHGVVVGTGPIPETALENLATEAERQAEQLATEVAAAETGLGDVTWSFHVIGVRLTAGPGPEPWAAIGTRWVAPLLAPLRSKRSPG
jgi:hypothetical protein